MRRLSRSLILIAGLAMASHAAAQGVPLPEATPDKLDRTDRIPRIEGKGWLGVGLGTQRLDGKDVVRVESVFKGSPADTSGFQAKDIILKFQGVPVPNVHHLVTAVGGTTPGSKVIFHVRRGKETFDVPLLLALRPDRLELLRSQTLNRPAPEFDVTLLGSKARLQRDKLRGKVVVLDFWATWCGPCRAAIPHLNGLHSKYKDRGVVVVGITDESAAEITKFTKKIPIEYLIGLDGEDRTANRDFFIQAYPTVLLMDQEGVIREVFIGASPDKIGKLETRIDELLRR
jgi:thiol-disulfide isomerase/thioredoxin